MQSERDEISILLARKYTHDEIAKALGRSQPAISREILRNSVRGIYDSKKAQHKAYVRTHNARWQFSNIHAIPELEAYITAGLKKGLPPETISGRMRQQKKPWYASKNAIYDWLYSARGQRWCKYLPFRRYSRRKYSKKKSKKTLIPLRVSIHDRPEMTTRDYEGDTVVSSHNTVSLVTIYSPVLMKMDARRVPNLKPTTVIRAFKSMLKNARATSLTLDNGQENRLHYTLGIPTYFCDPYASWQKPGIENANRLIRKYVRKGSDISKYSHQYITSIVKRYNNTPRKKLGWKTPQEVTQQRRNKKTA